MELQKGNSNLTKCNFINCLRVGSSIASVSSIICVYSYSATLKFQNVFFNGIQDKYLIYGMSAKLLFSSAYFYNCSGTIYISSSSDVTKSESSFSEFDLVNNQRPSLDAEQLASIFDRKFKGTTATRSTSKSPTRSRTPTKSPTPSRSLTPSQSFYQNVISSIFSQSTDLIFSMKFTTSKLFYHSASFSVSLGFSKSFFLLKSNSFSISTHFTSSSQYSSNSTPSPHSHSQALDVVEKSTLLLQSNCFTHTTNFNSQLLHSYLSKDSLSFLSPSKFHAFSMSHLNSPGKSRSTVTNVGMIVGIIAGGAVLVSLIVFLVSKIINNKYRIVHPDSFNSNTDESSFDQNFDELFEQIREEADQRTLESSFSSIDGRSLSIGNDFG
jgi:hypothetical protein